MTSLAPVTHQRLNQFRRRRNSLLTIRGVSAAIVVVLTAALVVVGVDAIWALPDMARWIVALSIYTAAAVVLAVTSIWPQLKGRSLTWIATVFEKNEPRLKNQLLAAVELANEPARKLDSTEFRNAVQVNVAKTIESVNVAQVLPWKLVGKWLLFCIAIVGIVVGLCALPQLYLANRLGRVLFPMANIGRVSSIAIELISPSPANTVVPEGDVVAVQAKIIGGRASSVNIETQIDGEEIAIIAMRPDSKTEDEAYVANLNPALGRMRYRIVAEDASTPWYQLDSKARPRAESFAIEYQYPAYTKLQPAMVQAEVGNLEAIVDSKAIVKIAVNQPIRNGELRIQNKDRWKQSVKEDSQTTIPLKSSSDGTMIAEVIVDKDATYRVHLEAKETDFVNSFSPTYSIKAVPDKAPKVRWLMPKEASVSVKPDQIYELSIETEDELELAKITQQVRSGKDEWSDFSVPVSNQKALNGEGQGNSSVPHWNGIRSSLTHPMDLAVLKVKPNDLVQTRWVITDLKGQSTTSSILDMYVTSASLDPNRHEQMLARVALTKEVEDFKKKVEGLREATKESRQKFESNRDDAENQKAFAQAMKKFAEQAKKEAEEVRKSITEKVATFKDVVTSDELEQVANVISRVEKDSLSTVEAASKKAAQSNEPQKARQALERATAAMDQSVDNVQRVTQRARDFTSHDVLASVSQDLTALHKFQNELKDSMGQMVPEQYRRRQALVARELHEVAEMTREQSKMLRNGADAQANQWADWMENQAKRINAVTGDDDRPKAAQESNKEREQLAQQMEQELGSHRSAMGLDGSLQNEINQGRNELRDRAGKAAEKIRALTEAVARSQDVNQQDDAEAQIKETILPALEQLASRRELQQAKSDNDSQYIADLGQAFRAAQAIAKERQQDPKEAVKKLEEVQKSLQKLEAVHQLQQASRTLNQLQNNERWKSGTPDAKLQQPRAWDAYKQTLEQSVNDLRQAGVPNELVAPLEAMRWSESSNKAGQKIEPRRWSNDPQVSAADDLQDLQKEFREKASKLDAIAKEARDAIAEVGPTVSELARDAAEQMKELSEKTNEVKQDIESGNVPDPKPQVAQLEETTKESSAPLQQLREALSDFASRQDIMKQPEAAAARDADAAISITNDAQSRINESLDSAKQASENKETQSALAKAADTQADAAEALSAIAEHFEALEEDLNAFAKDGESPDASKKAGALADAAADVARRPDLDRAHDDAQRLRRMAGSNPKNLLNQLEKELPKNVAMQQELSKISRDAIDDSLKTLNVTAEREEAMQTRLENSDAEFAEKKQMLDEGLSQAAQAAQRIADTTVPRVQAAADRAQTPDVRANLDQVRQDLRNAVQQASLVNKETPIQDALKATKALGRALTQAKKELEKNAQLLEKQSQEKIAIDENQLRDRKREMEEWQRRAREEDIRNAEHVERNIDQRRNQAEQAANQARAKTEQKQREFDEAKRKADDKPDDKTRQKQVTENEAKLANAKQDQAVAEWKKQEFENRRNTAKARKEQLQAQQPGELKASNPHAELGQRSAEKSAEQSQQIADDLKQHLKDTKWTEEPNASHQELANSTKQQDALQNEVSNASESLARAARHEQRLARPLTAEVLAQQAQQVGQIAEQQMAKAEENLQSATEQSKPNTPSERAQASAEATLASQASLQQAESALRQQAADLAAATSPQALANQQSSQNKAAQNDPSNNQNPSSLLSPQEMARMLDDLDRQMNDKNNASSSDAATPGQQQASKSPSESGQQSKSGTPGEPSDSDDAQRAQTLADAARRLASEMNQQRKSMESEAKQMPKTGQPESLSRSPVKPGQSTSGRVLPAEIKNNEDWGKLREQASEDTIDSSRETVSPAYRNQVDEYYRVLSKRKLKK